MTQQEDNLSKYPDISKIIKRDKCDLSEDKQYCGNGLFVNNIRLFFIDGLTLCRNHSEEYMHSEISSLSIHRKKFDKLLNRMKFTQ